MPLKREQGALVDYALLVGLIVIVSFVPLYQYFQNQTKPFCQVIAGIENVKFGKDLDWGNRGNIKACYKREATNQLGKMKENLSNLFEAGVVQIGN